MTRKNVHSYFILGFCILLSGCVAALQQKGTLTSTPTPTPTPTVTYSCSYYSEYDSLSDCQIGSLANCTPEWKTFPTGGISRCYYPVAGWEACAYTATDWVYTPGNAYRYGTAGADPLMVQYYSVVGCSSTICACLSSQVVGWTCDYGLDSGCPSPTPVPAATVAPIPTATPAPTAYTGYDCTQLNNATFSQPANYDAGPNHECTCTSTFSATGPNYYWPLTCVCNLSANANAKCAGIAPVGSANNSCHCL